MSSPSINEHIESFLSAIAGESGAPDAAETHIETWLAYILSKLGSSGDYAGLNGLTKFETLWENASPTSAFTPQVLPIDYTEYSYILVITRYSRAENYTNSTVFEPGQTGNCFTILDSSICRRAILTTNEGIQIGTGYFSTWVNITNSMQQSNNNAIPLKIIGIKVVS